MTHVRIVERETKTWALVLPRGNDYHIGSKTVALAVILAKKNGFLPYEVDKHGEITKY